MKPMKLFTPLRLATIAALLVACTSSAMALSPALRNFFLDFGLTADERAEQTQQQLDENGIAGTATPTSTGAVHVETDGKNAHRLLQLMNEWTIVTGDGASATATTGLRELAAKMGIENFDAVSITVSNSPTVGDRAAPASSIELGTAPKAQIIGPIMVDDEAGGPEFTSDELRAELKKRGMSDEIAEEVIRQFRAQYGK